MTPADAATCFVGPLGGPGPDEGVVVVHGEVRWLVSGRSAAGPLRLSDADPSGKLQIRVAPDSGFAARLGIVVGEAELFDDGTLLAGTAPGEWLALTPGPAAVLAEQLAGLVDPDDRPILADRSDGLALFRLTGPAAATVLTSCCAAVPEAGAVVTAPVAGCRCWVVRNDLPVAGGDDGGDRDERGDSDEDGDDLRSEPVGPPLRSYLIVCDRTLAPSVHAALVAAGTDAGIEVEGFAAYRSARADI
jgi:hypothetical protein